jgi:hypothetical protein
MTATSRIVSVRCGSDGPFDAGRSGGRPTTPRATRLPPTSVVEAFKQVVRTAADVEAAVEISGRRLHLRASADSLGMRGT